ncbi:MAG: ABC transporter substrate-binding protein [Actinomycetia bacterium]|nr:ABC transporter substrate-binding protein [Actinomycetes bacterium]
MIRLNKIVLTILLILIFISIYMYSCEYNDLGLFTTVNEEDEADSGKNTIEGFDINSKKFFLELKEKQMNKNLLNDSNIRKAIFYAIDRERIVNELLGEYGEVLNSLFEKNSYYYNPSWSEYDYDLNKAKEFLSRAGYGVDNPLYITIGSDNGISRQTIKEMIKEDLDKIGIEIWILNEPSEEWYQDCVMKGNYELGVWAIKNFDGSSLNFNFSSDKMPIYKTDENKKCENFYWYKNSKVDEILKKIMNEKDTVRKKELFQDFQDILADDAVMLPLYSRLFSIAYNKKIENIDISIKDNKVFFNIENWILSDEEQKSEDEINEIVIGYEGENYILPNLFDSNYISNLVLKGLWEINENGEYEPILVEEYYDSFEHSITSISSLEVKVTLKDKIFWEDGTPITSKDVKYTYDTILKNDSIVNINEDYSKIKGIEIINEKEFSIIFKENVRDWKKLFGIIFPEGSLEGKDINNFSAEDIIASGPYKIEKFVGGEYLLLKKNEFYFGEAPEIDYIRILFDTDINNFISMLKDGEIDLLNIKYFDLDLMRDIEENEDLNLWVEPGNMMEHLAICLKQKEE